MSKCFIIQDRGRSDWMIYVYKLWPFFRKQIGYHNETMLLSTVRYLYYIPFFYSKLLRILFLSFMNSLVYPAM